MLFKRAAVLEKIHGTSAHLGIDSSNHHISYFTGDNNEQFRSLFNEEDLWFRMENKPNLIVYGEHYGAKIQSQSKRYGQEKKFVAFDVMIGGHWLNVEVAHKIVTDLGLEFVPFHLVDCTLENLDYWRDAPSEQAVLNSISEPQMREGIVIRPTFEFIDHHGNRVIAKHKRPEFSETKTQREVREHPEKEKAYNVAEEWVTLNRLTNMISHHPYNKIEDTPDVIKYMIEDIIREGDGEVEDNKENRKAIGSAAAFLFKKYLQEEARSRMNQ